VHALPPHGQVRVGRAGRGVPRGGESDLPVPGAELRPRARITLRERVPLSAWRRLQMRIEGGEGGASLLVVEDSVEGLK
jgi:hypothetical protein